MCRIIAGQKFSSVYLTRKLAEKVRVFECLIANYQIFSVKQGEVFKNYVHSLELDMVEMMASYFAPVR